jgi:DNA (cytosine-5)-methyltransferase 1
MAAYYNEHDPYAAQWLRNLVASGHIAPGDVDERSIVDVRPDDLRGYTQCHFFAGIGGWSYALWLAGIPDDRPVWTGSCPCQPFSAAGKGKAGDDGRHLWPAWFSLIRECRPAIVFGEQVEAAIGWGWLDLVFSDLEAEGYACGASVLPACGVGAPHIRQRVWFVADASSIDFATGTVEGRSSLVEAEPSSAQHRSACALADDHDRGREVERAARLHVQGQPGDDAARRSANGVLADGISAGLEVERVEPARDQRTAAQRGGAISAWSDCVWLPCSDGKARPVEPGTFPLASRIPGRVGRLRAYGNAITPQVAAEFIRAVGRQP